MYVGNAKHNEQCLIMVDLLNFSFIYKVNEVSHYYLES